MRVDRDGRLLQQTTVWLPVEMMQLIKADRLNISAFIRQQLDLLYDLEPESGSLEHRALLVEAARESLARQREVDAAAEADRERARAAVRAMRAERDAAKARQDGITEALLQIAGDDEPGRFARILPENDPEGDRVDDWDALVRRVSRLCGAEIDTAEVAAGLRHLLASV